MPYLPDYKLEPDEEQPLFFCDKCNGDIYEGDDYYFIEGDRICTECLED